MNNSTETTIVSSNSSIHAFSTKDFVFQATNLVLSSYFLVALVIYYVKFESKKSNSKENSVLNIVCLLNATCAFVHVVKDLPILYIKINTKLFCFLLVDIAGGIPYFFGVSSAFGMLWYRQRKLYSSPVMKVFVFKGFNAINYLLLIASYHLWFLSWWFFCTSQTGSYTETKCASTVSRAKSTWLPWQLATACSQLYSSLRFSPLSHIPSCGACWRKRERWALIWRKF